MTKPVAYTEITEEILYDSPVFYSHPTFSKTHSATVEIFWMSVVGPFAYSLPNHFSVLFKKIHPLFQTCIFKYWWLLYIVANIFGWVKRANVGEKAENTTSSTWRDNNAPFCILLKQISSSDIPFDMNTIIALLDLRLFSDRLSEDRWEIR